MTATRTARPPLDVHQAAALLGESEQTVRLLARRGDLPARKSGRGGRTSAYRFRPEAIEEFIERREALTRSGRSA